MSICSGFGECLLQCLCSCFDDEEYKIPSLICNCGHRDHQKLIGGSSEFDIYCKRDCSHKCQLVECHNYKMCGQKRPQWLLNCDGGMCKECAVLIGKIKFVDVKGVCPICLENKDMIEISCGKHNVCLECWKEYSKTPKEKSLSCPLCRESIWKWKKY